MKIYKSVWLENKWSTSENMIEDFVEMGISCITYTAEYGDKNLEISAEKGEIEKICSTLRSYNVIDEEEGFFMEKNEVDIIVLY